MRHPTDRELDRLTEAVVRNYHSARRTQRIGSAVLPSRAVIVEIIGDLRQLLFPGFFGKLTLTRANVRYHVGDLLVRVGGLLAEQIFQCLQYGAVHEGNGKDPTARQAEALARKFLRRIPAIRDMLALDAQAAYDGDPAAKSVDEVIYCYPGFYAITVYRLAHELVELGVPLMPRIMSEHAHSVTGTDIHPGAQIGKSFFIDHATGVVIGETTRIGDNAKIYHGVTLGALSFPKDERGRIIKGLQRHPTLGDRVTIYPNATILGGATVIGSGATIGGNTYITESVPSNTVVGHKRPELSVRRKRRRQASRRGPGGTKSTPRR